MSKDNKENDYTDLVEAYLEEGVIEAIKTETSEQVGVVVINKYRSDLNIVVPKTFQGFLDQCVAVKMDPLGNNGLIEGRNLMNLYGDTEDKLKYEFFEKLKELKGTVNNQFKNVV